MTLTSLTVTPNILCMCEVNLWKYLPQLGVPERVLYILSLHLQNELSALVSERDSLAAQLVTVSKENSALLAAELELSRKMVSTCICNKHILLRSFLCNC